MDRWTHRPVFRAHVRRVREESRITLQEVAERLEISRSYLTQLLYTPTTRPELDLVQRMTRVLGCPLADLVDDAVATPGGVEMTASTEQARFFAQVIVKDMNAEDLNDDDRQELWEDFQRGLSRIRKRKSLGK